MSDDDSSDTAQEKNIRTNSEKAELSERIDSQTIGKGEEVVDVEPPEDGYVMAPTPNNPDRGNGNSDGDDD